MTIASIFTDFGSDLLNNLNKDSQNNLINPLKNHPQIPFIIDSLSRLEYHHVTLVSNQSDKIHQAFVNTIVEHVANENMPKSLRDCQFIYFDAVRFSQAEVSKDKIAYDFQRLTSQLKDKHQRIVFVIKQLDFFTQDNSNPSIIYFKEIVKQMLVQDEWRLIHFVSQKEIFKKIEIAHLFSDVHLAEPSNDDLIALLKMQRSQLELFHRAIISDEVIVSAFSMATHYLPGNSSFDKTLSLLDSAAARASMLDRHEHSEQKSIVTPHFLSQVISNCTQIPITHLQNNKFQVYKFVENIRKNIFGQDAAINLMASLLQNACIKLQDDTRPLCSFLLVGAQDVGKTEMAYAMAEHLFGSQDALLRVNLNDAHCSSLDEIKIFPRSSQYAETGLLSAILQTPYALVLLEDIDQMDDKIFNLIKNIFDQGYIIDEQNNKFDFRHAIIIATTRVASDQLSDEALPHSSQGNPKTLDLMQLDLMQLVLNENVHDSLQKNASYATPEELCDVVMPKLKEHFPAKFLQAFNIVPLVPLDYAALEKIVRAKIKILARRLHKSFSIELSFAPEVVKFLAHEALWRKDSIKSLDKLLEQHLYSTVTHEILLHAENKDRSRRLLIQLNESGHLLRCEFLTSNEAAFYSV